MPVGLHECRSSAGILRSQCSVPARRLRANFACQNTHRICNPCLLSFYTYQSGPMTPRRKPRSARKPPASPAISPWFYLTILGILMVFFAAIRFRLRGMPLERDEGEYAYAGQLMLQGFAPYHLAYSMKLPGTNAAYAVLMAVFGQTPQGIHLGLLLVNAATIILIFLLGRRMFGQMAGFAAAVSYALLSTSNSVLGFAAHATHFVVFAAIGALILTLEAKDSGRPLHYFLAGLLAGLAFLCKQPGLFLALFCGAYLALSEFQRAQRNLPSGIRNLLLYVAGSGIPLALTCVWLFFAHELGRMWFWTFTYGSKYGTAETLAEGWKELSRSAPRVLAACWPVWIIAAFGLAVLAWDSRVRQHRIFLLGLLVFSWAAVCPGFYFRLHYFILFLPVVSLLAGLAVSSLAHKLYDSSRSPVLAALPALVFLFAVGYSVYSQEEFLFELDPVSACRRIYGSNPFQEVTVISDYLKKQARPGSTVAVIGSEPEIYFYSRLHSATGYIYMYPLMERQQYALSMQQEMSREIEASQPEYLVFVKARLSWLPHPDSEKFIFDWFQKYAAANYAAVGIADGVGPKAAYIWGTQAETYQPKSDEVVVLLRRKDS